MDWDKLNKGNRTCGLCAREFKPGEDHFAGIEEQTGGFLRRDVCLTCWVNRPVRLFSYWKTRVPVPPQKPRENIRAAIAFFDRLAAETDAAPVKRKLHYLLALILMRRRRLKLLETRREDGVDILVLEKVWTGETVRLADPVIVEEEIDALRGELGHLFDIDHAQSEPKEAPVVEGQSV